MKTALMLECDNCHKLHVVSTELRKLPDGLLGYGYAIQCTCGFTTVISTVQRASLEMLRVETSLIAPFCQTDYDNKQYWRN